MDLIYNSGIDELVAKRIKGNIARVGGSVDQVINYKKNVAVQDINILDGGFGSIKSVFQGKSWSELNRIVTRKIKQEIKHLMYGDKIALDRKTIELDMHFVQLNHELKHKFDASISSNVVEHSPNVIFFLLNFYLITKEDGWLFHAIPNHRYTYDRFRLPTSLEHFIHDFEVRSTFSDTTHEQDYIQSAIEKDGWQKEFHKKFPVSYPFMHFHVFDENNTKELFSTIFEEVTCDVIRNDRFSDNVVLCRNRLNKQFADKYAGLIDEVKNGSYLPADAGKRK
jgi:hypothetical protein